MLCWDGKPLNHTRRKVIMDHSILIDNALTQNAADILLLPPHECSSHASCLQKEKDLIKILGRMDRQIAGIDATMSPGSKVTAQIAELARQSSHALANPLLGSGVAHR